MKLITKLLIGTTVLIACSSFQAAEDTDGAKAIENKKAPEYQGVDKSLQDRVYKFLELATKRGLFFHHRVTVGLKHIGINSVFEIGSPVIGLCNYGATWREIDLDQGFWDEADEEKRDELIFHELTHCYCSRGHDHDNGQAYPDSKIKERIERGILKLQGKIMSGFLNDDCPSSIMHPQTLNQGCFTKHKDYYLSEMLDRCYPW